ncbi:HET-domain-containing protein [Dothidotthia symphoricarpi CBS 119687]|uniref:HET-domain-containing protein n=1 Tax=Dothidotthia symphoricarpi CBS 119687 TaxID=1392245 RepID=A0A6A5ZYF5_9PLEO|nr:HET-domain-containing protein [Dothidotthia symphoricarpi CBS 119687]KAF2124326.1 HET-domain-containing protein [Dothidotthia symphoricarpi CBS 119687]
MGSLPTRVIDVGDGTNPPRIYSSAAELEPYAALSYCWGQGQNLRLLSTNRDKFHSGISLSLLPRTIADAITITRRMGVKYLWVDALCILQDSVEDLEKELSCMGDIYANAKFTIAAKDSTSSVDGCFRQRNWPTSAIVPLDIRLPGNTILKEHGTRGWTLQEELLSRRMLNCGKDELSWNCLESKCSERLPEEEDSRTAHRFQSAFRRVLVTGIEGYGNLNSVDEEDLFNYWLDTVENYMRRIISDLKDKLVAVAGVQGAIGKILKDAPVAGIWRERFFASSLLWRISNKTSDTDIEPFRCPSWSWGSVSRPVVLEVLPRNASAFACAIIQEIRCEIRITSQRLMQRGDAVIGVLSSNCR